MSKRNQEYVQTVTTNKKGRRESISIRISGNMDFNSNQKEHSRRKIGKETNKKRKIRCVLKSVMKVQRKILKDEKKNKNKKESQREGIVTIKAMIHEI